MASPTAVVRTRLQQSTGGYCPKLPHTSDMEMWMRIATCHSIAVIQDTQAYYRWHGTNMVLQYCAGPLGDLPHRLATCEHVYSNWHGGSIPGFKTWMADMRYAFSKQATRAAIAAKEANDWSSYQQCIAFAHQVTPGWRAWHIPLRVHSRQLLNSAAWRSFRRALGRLRDRRSADASAVSDWRLGSNFGWWPT